MADQKITHRTLKGAQIDTALDLIAEKNPKADLSYLRGVPAYAVDIDGKPSVYLWLKIEGKSFRISGAVSLGRRQALTMPVLDYLKGVAARAGLDEIYFFTSRAGMVKQAQKAGFMVGEVVMVAGV
ncbi:hypothetical protein [Emcibacter nanhaiensis]|uniref:Uncharacterized protein n=1 Tax=Emcibacter nanhaiensis TaxID=1505037 RepID=A0A501PSC6_9PROT|nr:hypothetical protein [Emcibacter nanhaiensis]TPD62997.1 hypothetical protein FIV46_02650 [Emcibacter nanhaiensis]